LLPRLRHRKTRRRLISDSRGFSSIVGAIFAVLVMFSLISTVFVWSLSQNTLYNNTVRQSNQADLDRSSEKVQVLNTTYNAYSNGNVTVSAQIQNTGPSSVQFITVWLYVSNTTWTNYNFSKLTNATVQGGNVFPLNVNLTISGLNSTANYNIASWLITARGNVVALQKTTLTTNIVISQTTQGIGALMMDFQNFTYYNVTGSFGSYSLNPYPNGASGYFVTNSGGPKGQIAFRVIFTDLDQNQRAIVLGSGSELFIIYPFPGGAYQCDVWYVVNVNTAGQILNAYTPVTLVYNVPTAVYFAAKSRGNPNSVGGTSTTGISPVNLALVGQIGGSPFGQNIPFVSIEVAS